MPKVSEIAKCKHPNSRKTKSLSKQMKRQQLLQKQKVAQNIKQNLIGEKLLWFKQRIVHNNTVCTPEEVLELIEKYLSRFDEELEQIRIKNSVGQRKRQHASREDIINMTIKREKKEFKTCGIEVADLLNPTQLKLLREWNGELRFLPNFVLKRINKKSLLPKKDKNKKPTPNTTKSENDTKMEIDVKP